MLGKELRDVRATTIVGAIVVAVAACGGEDIDFGTHGAAITHGAVYGGHPAVGLLRTDLPGGKDQICTGTLIGQRTVLTAAHCVVSAQHVTFELDLESHGVGRQSFVVDSMKPHPDYRATSTDVENDIAVLHLAEAPQVSPVAISTQTPWLGLPVTLVGFGLTANDQRDDGVKRRADNTVSAVTAQQLGFVGGGGNQGNYCLGDSGGPSFAQINGVEVQIGVHSYLFNGPDGNPCSDDARSMRVDAYADWIREAARGDLATHATAQLFNGDTAPPQVTILSPENGSFVPSVVTIRASAVDNTAVKSVMLLLDGRKLDQRNGPPYDFGVTLPAGAHTVVVVGEDVAGNRAETTVLITASASAGASGTWQDGGCNVGGGDTSSGVALLLALIWPGLLWRRRRSPAA